MDLTVVNYIALVVVVLILIWAIVEMSGRFKRRNRNKPGVKTLQPWTTFDITTNNAMHEEPHPVLHEDEQEEKSEQDLHFRAQQNGHYSESKKPS